MLLATVVVNDLCDSSSSSKSCFTLSTLSFAFLCALTNGNRLKVCTARLQRPVHLIILSCTLHQWQYLNAINTNGAVLGALAAVLQEMTAF